MGNTGYHTPVASKSTTIMNLTNHPCRRREKHHHAHNALQIRPIGHYAHTATMSTQEMMPTQHHHYRGPTTRGTMSTPTACGPSAAGGAFHNLKKGNPAPQPPHGDFTNGGNEDSQYPQTTQPWVECSTTNERQTAPPTPHTGGP